MLYFTRISLIIFPLRTNLTKIQNLQKKALRLIHFEKFNAPSLPIYLKSKILPIDKQVIYYKTVSLLMTK